ncbi:hypothetical protein ACGFZ9_09365 [Streptomyces mirabilis]|uniref:hypothetical protein n=1 Tax=Streptomyces mirabilis TaxID=68239 RepID=UPI003718D33E
MAIANTIGLHTAMGQVLLYLAPAFSVAAGSFFYMLKNQVDWYADRWQVKRARKTMEKSLAYPHTSEEHKKKIREMLEEIDASVASSELDRIKLLGNK